MEGRILKGIKETGVIAKDLPRRGLGGCLLKGSDSSFELPSI
jgi:hypothetical protein